MIHGDDRWDELLRNKLEPYSAAPPDRVWQGIRAKMPPEKTSGKVVYLRWVLAAAAVVLALITGVLLIDNSVETQPGMADQNKTVPVTPEYVNPGSEPRIAEAVQVQPLAEQDETVAVSLSPAARGIAARVAPVETPRIQGEMPFIQSIRSLLSVGPANNAPGRQLQHIVQADHLSESDRMIIAANADSREVNVSDQDQGWKVGLHLSPGYSSHTASYDDAYARSMTYSGDRDQTNLGGGFSVQYKTNSRWRVESGVYYSKTGGSSGNSFQVNAGRADYAAAPSGAEKYFNTGVSLQQGQLAMNSMAGVIKFSHTPSNTEMIAMPETLFGMTTAMLTPGEFSQEFDFVEIPLYARFLVLDSQFDVELIGGLSTNFTVGNHVYMESNSGRERVGSTQDISAVNFSGTAGVGIIYALGKNISVSMEPRINYYLNSLNHSGNVNFRPWRAGIFTGLSYEF